MAIRAQNFKIRFIIIGFIHVFMVHRQYFRVFVVSALAILGFVNNGDYLMYARVV